jgi:3',5'-cyclic AMP phosphodiesterase CpdA
VKHQQFLAAVAVALTVAATSAGCASGPAEDARANAFRPDVATSDVHAPTPPPGVESVDVVAVGDIACDPSSPNLDDPSFCRHEEVAQLTHELVRQGAKYFIPLGDIQYEQGGLDAFEQVYDRSFGDLRSITRPVPGNHEYKTEGASGYFEYFGSRAGSPEQPWRSFSPMPGWRIYLLDSNCEYIGGCGPDSPQGQWLADELTSSAESCSIAAWHHPLHTSGEYDGDQGTIDRARPLWDAVGAGGVDVILNGHDHIYDRFAPIGGMTEFVVGTGGKDTYHLQSEAAGSKVAFDDTVGALRLTLRSDRSYDYAFIDASTGQVADAGSHPCGNQPAQ